MTTGVDPGMYPQLLGMRRGQRIRVLRILAGLSQEALAERVNRTRATVSDWETKDAQTDLDTVHELALIFNVPVEVLTAPSTTTEDEDDDSLSDAG